MSDATRHLVNLQSWSGEEIRRVIDAGIRLKADPAAFADRLAGRSLAMLFQKTSTRTRCSGEVGMFQLGGQAVFLDWRATNFGLADLADEIRVLSRYFDFILTRFLSYADVVTVADAADVPVMNGCCDRYHPLQALCDLQTVQEKLGRLEGVHLVYVGVHNNVTNSLITAGLRTGMRITVVAPEMNESAVDDALFAEARASNRYVETEDVRGAVANADVVYTDTWLDMEYFDDPEYAEEKARRIRLFEPYQLNRALLRGSDALIMHCLPAHRGYEIEGELVDDPRSVVFDQAENRLHSQKSALLALAGLLP
ncbi:MAG: ornithine carbamoyltransferase [Candidatus Latescibacteria bacterium]|jgi:ornithine carbamoyltransferase|nr:ornithine carbamoyltransferase [Candidatus Latescibacterota bacterium]MDP7447066.1 ornithine carbamoyltransferase [Candidatus Latescibacterota bacterium]HJP29323.1 ornithine carbamoyltransferase [Candidatus Latescibacterota bacterium]